MVDYITVSGAGSTRPEQVKAGSGVHPIINDPAALRVVHSWELVPCDLRASHVISLGAVINNGIWQALATPRPYDVTAILRAHRAEGQTCVEIAF